MYYFLPFNGKSSLHERASVLVIRTLPVLFKIAVVHPTSPVNSHFPSGQNWTQCSSLRGTEHLFLISYRTEKLTANIPER